MVGEEQLKPEEQTPVVTGEVITEEGGTVGIKRLLRSRRNRVVGGVCGGIAEYLNLDPVLVRALWVLLTAVTAVIPGTVLYFLAMILIPEDLAGEPDAGARPRVDNRVLWGGLLILAGLYFLSRVIWGYILPVEWIAGWSRFWDVIQGMLFPLVLVGAGVLLVLGLSRGTGTARGRLARPRQGRLLAGVCGGIGRYFRVDPVWVRLVWVLLFFASWWAAVVGYILAMLLMPEE
jgi:phage shock protein C